MSSVAERNAYGSALILANEQYETSPLIIDTYAIRLLPPTLHLRALATHWAPATRAMIAATEKKIRGGWAGMLCRKRYIDEQLIDALADGLEAVTGLGGGFDTRLYRIPQLTGVLVWEIGPAHPDLPVSEIERAVIAQR
ncbi:class I SAM-dependent methyltransferase [Mycobacteroides salmoniphilum]|uniref:class I SAM-dependent methyltransferase n=1 Tax=Mycobacteroides salmoniphilum TaxID=404941 RepID=UPI001065BADA|nr:class I SAM-dependent methyltransferase [Mycobacteroides salmoniphilum]TDZ98047.1 Leucine carboxyl methyltransferase [Mycobacteroides salmoniphilum]